MNLKERTDRKFQILQELQRVKIKEVKFFEGFTGGHKGFNKSMFEILKSFKDCEKLLVLEDDCFFYNDFEESINQLPGDWDLISLGSNLKEDHFKFSPNLYELKDAWMTHSIGYSNRLINWIIENYNQDLVYDEWLRLEVYPKFKCYMTNPIAAWQRLSYSDLNNDEANYIGILASNQIRMK